jgi:hypothetical protein
MRHTESTVPAPGIRVSWISDPNVMLVDQDEPVAGRHRIVDIGMSGMSAACRSHHWIGIGSIHLCQSITMIPVSVWSIIAVDSR